MSDDECFLIEVLPHLVALRCLARRLGREPEDLVQETYVRALAARRSYRPGSNAKAWLHRILVNVAMTEHRKRARDRRLEERLAAQPEPEPPAATPDPQQRTELAAALGQLTSADQEVVRLADLEGLRYRDVARVLGCPLGTVMSRLHRARRRLRTHLAQAA